MCNFLSAIITPTGDVLWHPMVDSHSDLVRIFKLNDDKKGRFAKVELLPGDHLLDVDKWMWHIDEETRPTWLDDIERMAEKTLRAIAKNIIHVDETLDLIVDGCHIFGGKTAVESVRGGRVISIGDSATIKEVRDSATINYVSDSATIRADYRTPKK